VLRDVGHSTAVSRIEQCIEGFDDDCLETFSDDDGRTIGWVIERDGNRILIESVEGQPCFDVQYHDDVVAYLQHGLTAADARRVLADQESLPPGSTELRRQAAFHLLGEAEEEVKERFIYQFVQLLSNPGQSFGLDVTADNIIQQFFVNESIYPYSDTFSIREYDQAVQSVASIGQAASLFVTRVLDVEGIVEAHTQTPPTVAFQ
jgi:hypothetical protein